MDEMAISKFKATCLAAVERVRTTGRPLLITKHGEPVAQVVPPPPADASVAGGFGSMAGTFEILDEVDGPLPEEWWLPDMEKDWDDAHA